MCHRGAFREDINKKCLLCEKDNNGIEHVINEFEKLEKEWNKIIVELNKLDDKIKNKTLLESIEYFYYSKKLSNAKGAKKKDKKGIELIKHLLKTCIIYMEKLIVKKKIKKYKQ